MFRYHDNLVSSVTTTVILMFISSKIHNQSEDHYFNTINYVLQWCKDNYLDLNVTKTKEMIHDFRKTSADKRNVTINGTEVTGCSEYKYLGCFIQEDLKWNTHIDEQIKKCNKRQFLLRILNSVYKHRRKNPSALLQFHVNKCLDICDLLMVQRLWNRTRQRLPESKKGAQN